MSDKCDTRCGGKARPKLLLFLSSLGAYAVSQAAGETRLSFVEPCEEALVLAYWQGDKPLDPEVRVVAADPAPAEGKGCVRVTTRWAEGGPGYSYWNVPSFQPFELRKGVKYAFKGKVFCSGGEVQPKVMFDLPLAKVQPIWHGTPAPKGEGWREFSIPDLRGLAEALSKNDRWDTDTVMLTTLFFNVTGKPKMFAVDDLQVTAEGTPLPQFVRPQKADYAVPAGFPLLRFRLKGAFAGLTVSARGAHGKEEPLLNADAFGAEAAKDGDHVLHARLSAIPRWVLLRCGKDSKCEVGAIEILMPDRKVVPQTGEPPDFPGEVGMSVASFDPKSLIGSADGKLPERKLPPIRIGVYYASYVISDPGHLPSSAWLYHPRPEVVAAYDFSVLQTQGMGEGMVPSREFCGKVKQVNPEHRIILRLACTPGAVPGYYFEPFYRRGLLEHYADLVKSAGPENVYAVTIGEEECGNLLAPWWSKAPPDWVDAYRQPFERETKRKLVWSGGGFGSAEFLDWLLPKVRFFFNDIYEQLKSRFPNIKVLQYIAIANDGSGIAWHEPGEIKADGWVYWNFHGKKQLVLVDCRLPGSGETVPVCMMVDGMFRNLLRVRNSGLPNEEIYHCGFAHEAEGKYYDVVEQVQMLQDLGFRNSFMFYPTGAFLQPEDCNDKTRLAEIDRDPYRTWRRRRVKVLEYRKQIG